MARLKGAGGVQKSRSGLFSFGGSSNSERRKDERNLEDRIKSEIFANNLQKGRQEILKADNNNKNNAHKRQESDSRISLNFVRGFRRENTDFFPLSKRHSAVLEQTTSQPAPQVPLRSSAIFRRNNNPHKGEPILTDFVSNKEREQHQQQSLQPHVAAPRLSARNIDLLRPRREKTESVIVLKNRQVPENQQQVNTYIKKHQIQKKNKQKMHLHNIYICIGSHT